MGAEQSAQSNPKSQEDSSAEELSTEVNAIQEGDSVVDSKVLQKNGQIASLTSLNAKTDDQTDLNRHLEDNTLAEVGDGVSVSQKEEVPETVATTQEELDPQVNGEKEEKASPDATDITACEEKAAEQMPGDANEVGFKKIFRFVGFKFTLKKDKDEKTDPVQLLTVKEKEGEEASGSEAAEDVKEEGSTTEEEVKSDEKQAKTESAPAESATAEDTVAVEAPAEPADVEAPAKEEGAEELQTSPASAEAGPSSFRKFFSQFNLRKMASFKKGKEGDSKETTTDEEEDKTEEATMEEGDKAETEGEAKVEDLASIPVAEAKPDTKPQLEATPPEEPKTNAKAEAGVKLELTVETRAAAAEITEEAKLTEKAEHAMEGEKAPVDFTTETELLSSQEKLKSHGSPLKKLFTGAGLKKLSTKKKNKKDTEAKLTESGEQAAELQSSTEPSEVQKPESEPSSPEESGEHVVGAEASQEPEGEAITSDEEKKKEGILPWSSFKKMVTPKKRVKRPSESDEEAPADKPKSSTLSSIESAMLVDKPSEEESKPSETEKLIEEDPKNENAEKLESSTEEPRRKMDTSVSWEALMCMGGAKKRTRKTSDSDDETKIEEEVLAVQATAEQEPAETAESPILTSQEANTEAPTMSSPELATSPPERESTWDTLKRLVSRNKPKGEEKLEENAEPVLSDSEIPKEESSFSLRKLLPGRRKKKLGKQQSTELGSGEEDSDTPAVVPLSEYDAEPKEGSEIPTITVEKPDIPQINVSTEDRSPSWISVTPEVEVNTEEKHEPLSDIPEEGEHAATPKSADTTIAEDDENNEDTILSPMAPPKRFSRRLSTAEVVPLAPIPASGQTTPVPQGPQSETAQLVLESAVPLVNEIPSHTSVAVEDVPLEQATAEIEYVPSVENAEAQTKTILEVHIREEAMAICTGLGTKEIAKVALEKPVVSTVECVTVVVDALAREVAVKGMAEKSEQAVASEDLVLEAQVQQVQVTELEPETVDMPSLDIPEPETASEQKEQEIAPVASMVSLYREEEVVPPSELTENSPKVELVEPITPTVEETICCDSVEVAEPAIVEIKSEDIKEVAVELAVKGEISPVGEMVRVLTEEMSSALSEEDQSTLVEVTEPAIPVVAPNKEYAIAKETICLVAPLPENIDRVEITQDEGMEKVPISKPAGGEPIQVQTKDITSAIANAGVEPGTKAHRSKEDSIEVQGLAIPQVVLQSAMDEVSEALPEPEKPITPTVTPPVTPPVTPLVTPPATNETPTPVQAVATVEREVEQMAEEKPVITEAPVILMHVPAPAETPKAPKVVHTAVQIVESIAVEVTECINGTPEDTPTEAAVEKKKPELKQAAEVIVSEEEVTKEEIKAVGRDESQPEETKEKSKEDVSAAEVTDVKKETTPEVRVHTQVVLQAAQVIEEQTDKEFKIEAVVEFDSSGNVKEEVPAADGSVLEVLVETDVADIPMLQDSMSRKPQTALDATHHEVPACSPAETVTEKVAAVKCAQVMAQVMEVIEEAVKEIEPVSTEITAAS
ncbi:A-kinase anchor protein 12b [Aplochiton taeniatus]